MLAMWTSSVTVSVPLRLLAASVKLRWSVRLSSSRSRSRCPAGRADPSCRSRRPGRGGPDIVSMPIPPFRKVTVSTVLPSAPAFRRRWPRCPARRRSTDIAIPVLSVQTTVRVTDRAIVSRRTQNGGRPRRLPLSCSPPVAFRSFCYLVDTLFDCRSLPSTGSVKCLLRGKAVQKAAQEFKV